MIPSPPTYIQRLERLLELPAGTISRCKLCLGLLSLSLLSFFSPLPISSFSFLFTLSCLTFPSKAILGNTKQCLENIGGVTPGDTQSTWPVVQCEACGLRAKGTPESPPRCLGSFSAILARVGTFRLHPMTLRRPRGARSMLGT